MRFYALGCKGTPGRVPSGYLFRKAVERLFGASPASPNAAAMALPSHPAASPDAPFGLWRGAAANRALYAYKRGACGARGDAYDDSHLSCIYCGVGKKPSVPLPSSPVRPLEGGSDTDSDSGPVKHGTEFGQLRSWGLFRETCYSRAGTEFRITD